jgi:hypothetical protein
MLKNNLGKHVKYPTNLKNILQSYSVTSPFSEPIKTNFQESLTHSHKAAAFNSH